MRPRIAILGAGGFVGARFVEVALTGGEAEVIPIIRGARGAARLARFGEIWVSADAAKPAVLIPVIRGADAVVNLTVGETGDMEDTAEAVWVSCREAGVSRLVHLSTAEVFGPVLIPDLGDDDPPWTGHWMPYARAKAAAEKRLRHRMIHPQPSVVVLRPGLIWGPRSPWLEVPAGQLVQGTAFLRGDGAGICNLIHVDNLVSSVLAVAKCPKPVSGFFNVSDEETVTWADYFAALCHELGVDPSTIHRLPAAPYHVTLADRLALLKQGRIAAWLKRNLSRESKRMLKRLPRLLEKPTLDAGIEPPPRPAMDRSLWSLQTSKFKPATRKFAAIYGNSNRLRFPEAMAAAGAWLRFAGYARR